MTSHGTPDENGTEQDPASALPPPRWLDAAAAQPQDLLPAMPPPPGDDEDEDRPTTKHTPGTNPHDATLVGSVPLPAPAPAPAQEDEDRPTHKHVPGSNPHDATLVGSAPPPAPAEEEPATMKHVAGRRPAEESENRPTTKQELRGGLSAGPQQQQDQGHSTPPPFPYAQPAPNQQPQPPAFPYAQEVPGQSQQPPASPAAHESPAQPPAPFPYAQEIPGQAPPPPAYPYTQENTAQPSAPEPFPYAQEIPRQQPQPPASFRAQESPAQTPTPFPYAQEIPGQAPAEPFPYAQEIPGQASRQKAPEPFPWAQEIPGQVSGQATRADMTRSDMAAPLARGPRPSSSPTASEAPPVVAEPWLNQAAPKKRRGGKGKKVVFGVGGGLALAALVAAGGFYVLKDDGDDGGQEPAAGVRTGAALFPVDPAARADGRGQELSDAAASGTTVVAVGSEIDPAAFRGVFLVSADGGRTFQAASVKSADGGEPGSGEVPRMVAGGDRHGWVAIGSRSGGGGAVWTSDDGRAWRRLADSAGDVFGPSTRVQRIIATDDGFLAIGAHSARGDFSDAEPAVWLSGDGQNWETRFGRQVGLPAAKGALSLLEVAAAGGTTLLESSVDLGKKGTFRRVWVSSDGGRRWAPAGVPAPKGSRGLTIGGGRDGFIAVRDTSAGGQAYLSSDGKSWKTGGRLRASGFRQTQRLLAGDGGYTALVTRGRDTLVMRSADGRSWQDAGSLVNASGRLLMGTAVTAQTTVAVGHDARSDDTDALLSVWDRAGTAVPVDPTKIAGAFHRDLGVSAVAAVGAKAVAVGGSNGDAAAWTSADGTTWTRGRIDGAERPAIQRLQSVAGGPAGWVAVGDGGEQPRHPLVVTSADGLSWRSADKAGVFAQRGRMALATYGAAANKSGYVVVGEDGLSGAVWFSSDLRSWQRGRGVARDDLTAAGRSNRWLRAAAGGPFGFVAAGGYQDLRAPAGQGARPAVWTSEDGRQWRLRPLRLPAGIALGSLGQVAARDKVIVALGIAVGSAGLTPLGFRSADGGRTWKEVRVPAPADARDLSLNALTATPRGFVATGTTDRQGASDVVRWTSADGSAWQVDVPGGKGLSGAGDQQVSGLTALGDRLLGVGRDAARAEDVPLLWSVPLP
ncbi:hypothetical protein [Actinomadura parmotrematis]|uniref:Exo-alpha-sialidase n=1 Tax=Actinomadura parmotrematis TaxID=2864039 RepID=A0ABS7FXY5_9ACTN|nr:hypothetical protein [Actinomadura parmotrematis]MBW8485300.1 hypothetical protein [Actinomadura parmotrematis]